MINNKKNILAVITARGGSKTIPKKNIVNVGGKPLIAWTIEVALKSRLLDRVIVSTDDQEIAEISKKWGADVPFIRPTILAKDDTPHIPVLIHSVKWLEAKEKIIPDSIMLLQPTLPFRKTEDIDNAINLLYKKKADSVVSVCRAFNHPYLVKYVLSDGKLKDFIKPPEGYLSKQNLPKVYVLNGAVYIVKRDILINKKTFYTNNTYAYIMPQERSLDIDTKWELFLADLILKEKRFID